jgi:hypothetical protein
MVTYLRQDILRCCNSHILVTFCFHERIPTSSDAHSQYHQDICGLRPLFEHIEAPENDKKRVTSINLIPNIRSYKIYSRLIEKHKLHFSNLNYAQ